MVKPLILVEASVEHLSNEEDELVMGLGGTERVASCQTGIIENFEILFNLLPQPCWLHDLT